MDVNFLRGSYPEFTYRSYNWKITGGDLLIRWQMGNQKFIFSPTLTIKNVNESLDKVDKEIIDNLVFHLGMVEIFTYWKAFCSPVVNVQAGYLDDDQLKFWHKLFVRGMGQYYFENNINFTQADFLTIKTNGDPHAPPLFCPSTDNILVAIGGGKDSAVSLDLVSRNYKTGNILTFSLNEDSYPAIAKINEAAGNPKRVIAKRPIDPLLIKLNNDGFLNGHTPFSAYLAFLSVLISVITDTRDIVLSNERSSNEGNTEYLGVKINHQYSKSYEFEKDLREYNKKYLSKTNYFSLMRPLYELQISKLFAESGKFHGLFVSCNRGKDHWCGKCPKCASTFLGLYPFLSEKQMKSIFGANYFEDRELVDIYRTMVDTERIKPFECVGTIEETRIAMYLSYQKIKKNSKYPVMEFIEKEVLPLSGNWKENSENLLKAWDTNNFLNGEFTVILKNAYV